MGVLKFQQWLRNKFRDFHSHNFKTLNGTNVVRRLFIDFNAVIHNAVNIVFSTDDEEELERMIHAGPAYWTSEGGVVDTIMDELKDLIKTIKPTRLLYLAADGVVMKAKLMQQRQRSYKAGSERSSFNRNNVKPGTDFMTTICKRVRDALKTWAKEVMIDDNGESDEDGDDDKNKTRVPHEIHMSDAFDPGEGEHKIMTIMGSNLGKNPDDRRNREVDVVYSPDSDMHFLCYLHGKSNNIIIMRKVHEVGEDGEKYEYFHASETKNKIIQFLGFTEIRDFVLISCFGGNDFVPALPFAKFGDGDVFETLTWTFHELFRKKDQPHNPNVFFTNNEINWRSLWQYLGALKAKSVEFLAKAALDQVKRPFGYYNSETEEDRRSSVLTWALVETKSGKSQFDEGFFNRRYKQYIFGTFHTSDMVREKFNFDSTDEQCRNYLEGLVWVMKYYDNQGSGVNHDWAYVFHYPPDVVDLKDHIEKHLEYPIWNSMPLYHNNHTLNTPLEHLVTILKKDELYLVPQIVSTLFLDQMPHLFPEEVRVDKTSIPFGVEGKEIVLIDFPNMAEIRRTFDMIRDDPVVKRMNKPRKTPSKVWVKSNVGKKTQ